MALTKYIYPPSGWFKPAASLTSASISDFVAAAQAAVAPLLAQRDAAGASGVVFPAATWLNTKIPASPVLDANSATWAGYLSASGKQRTAGLFDYGVTVVPASAVNASTPRYDIAFTNVPAWGSDPFGSYTVPIPNGTLIPPGSDGQLVIADPTTGMVFGLWQATHSGSTWGASWGGMTTLAGNGVDTSGSTTATGLSRMAGVVTGAELTAAAAANTGLSHALFCASDICSSAFVSPAVKSDGDNAGGVAVPIPEGTRVQLDPSVNVDAISGITKGEKVLAKTLQTYGGYIADKGGSRLGVIFEYLDGTSPGAAYSAQGLAWDYYDLTKIPWASLRVLKKWDGSA